MNRPKMEDRLAGLSAQMSEERLQGDFPIPRPSDANNHIHTFFSFSPYSPTLAVYRAYRAGLPVAGIVDHDSVSGLHEFQKAAQIAKIASTGGVEVRVKFDRGFGTINNPDQKNCMYMAAHGLCETQVEVFDQFLAPYRRAREDRNRKMCDRINAILAPSALHLDYDRDIRPLSKATEGGSVTERHLLFGLATKLEIRFGRNPKLIGFLEETMGISVGEKQRILLTDASNAFFLYDLLGILKTDTSRYYVPASNELPQAEDFIRMAKSCGAIPAYAYLGDVTESVTQDKRAQKFEDSYLDELIRELKIIGVPALTYMPTRNTPAQLKRIRELCVANDLFQISGEDINSPRQKFACEALSLPENHHLIDSTWALIGHESQVRERGVDYGMFGSAHQHLTLSEKICLFSAIGLQKNGGNSK